MSGRLVAAAWLAVAAKKCLANTVEVGKKAASSYSQQKPAPSVVVLQREYYLPMQWVKTINCLGCLFTMGAFVKSSWKKLILHYAT
jgi:hypothetical protein